jgi:hypothetical protein
MNTIREGREGEERERGGRAGGRSGGGQAEAKGMRMWSISLMVVGGRGEERGEWRERGYMMLTIFFRRDRKW